MKRVFLKEKRKKKKIVNNSGEKFEERHKEKKGELNYKNKS